MEIQPPSPSASQASSQAEAQYRQQAAGSAQQGAAASGASGQQQGDHPGGAQQGGPAGSTPGGDAGRRGGGASPYAEFFSGRGGRPIELLRRLDEDVDRLFHEFMGTGRELLRQGLRGWGGAGGMGSGGSAGASASGAGSEAGEAGATGSAGTPTASHAPASGWLPQLEVCERGGRLHVSVDLPGLVRENVQLSIEDGHLVLQGERRSTHTSAQPGGLWRSERLYGSFRRTIPLPEGVDPDSAEAHFQHGVLDVSFAMPVRSSAPARSIPIRDGAPAAADVPRASGTGSEVGPGG